MKAITKKSKGSGRSKSWTFSECLCMSSYKERQDPMVENAVVISYHFMACAFEYSAEATSFRDKCYSWESNCARYFWWF